MEAAKQFRASNAEVQAQNVLIKKLGLQCSRSPVNEEAVAAYCASFQDQVSASKFEAFKELFPGTRWEDEVALAVPADVVC